MKSLAFYLLIGSCFILSSCYKDNDSILLHCNNKPTIINKYKWKDFIPLNDKYIYKSEIVGDNIFLFCDSLNYTKLIIYNKVQRSSSLIYIPQSLRESVVLGSDLYFIETENQVASIVKINLLTKDKTILVSEYPGFFIRNLHVLDGQLFYFLNYPETWSLAKIKKIDLTTLIVSDFHQNTLNQINSFARNAFVWKSKMNTYKVSYLHTDPILAITTFDTKTNIADYTRTFSFDNSFMVSGALGKNYDFYLRHFNTVQLTSVLDLTTGETKFEYNGQLNPLNQYHSLAYDKLIDSSNGSVIIGNENKREIIFTNEAYAFIFAYEQDRSITLRQLNLNNRCFDYVYTINDFNDYTLLDVEKNEIMILSQKSNTITTYEIRN